MKEQPLDKLEKSINDWFNSLDEKTKAEMKEQERRLFYEMAFGVIGKTRIFEVKSVDLDNYEQITC